MMVLKIWTWWHKLVILRLKRQTQVDLWSAMTIKLVSSKPGEDPVSRDKVDGI